MKLLLKNDCSNEFTEAPSTGVLDITPDQARSMLELMAATSGFSKQMADARLGCEFFSISVGAGDRLPVFQLLETPFELEGEGAIAVLPNDYDFEGAVNHSTEAHRVDILQDQIRFESLDKHSEATFTSAWLSTSLLAAIMGDQETDLPAAIRQEDEVEVAD